MMGECEFRNISRIRHSLPKRPQKRTIRHRWALEMVSTSYPNDHPDAPFLSDGCSKWIRKLTQTIAKMNHSPAMGAQNGFDKLPKRCQRCPIPERWALEIVSKYRKNEPLPSDGRSKWLRQVTKTMPKMPHSPAMGAQNGFKVSQKRTIPQRWALKMDSRSGAATPLDSRPFKKLHLQ